MGPRVRRNRPRGAAAPDLGLDSLAAAGIAAGFPPPFVEALGGAGPASLARAAQDSQPNGNGHADLPEGINVEEARSAPPTLHAPPQCLVWQSANPAQIFPNLGCIRPAESSVSWVHLPWPCWNAPGVLLGPPWVLTFRVCAQDAGGGDAGHPVRG